MGSKSLPAFQRVPIFPGGPGAVRLAAALAGALTVVACPAGALAGDGSPMVAVEVSRLHDVTGYTLRLGAAGSPSGGMSRLRFAFDQELLGVVFRRWPAGGTGGLPVVVRLVSTVAGPRGTLTDSDWIGGAGGSGPDGLDRMPDLRSDSRLLAGDGALADIALVVVGGGEAGSGLQVRVGYRYERFRFTGGDTHQLGSGSYARFTLDLPGPTIRYTAPQTLGYAALGWHPAGQDGPAFELLYAPCVAMAGYDDHLRREEEWPPGSGRVAEGKWAGARAGVGGGAWGPGSGVPSLRAGAGCALGGYRSLRATGQQERSSGTTIATGR